MLTIERIQPFAGRRHRPMRLAGWVAMAAAAAVAALSAQTDLTQDSALLILAWGGCLAATWTKGRATSAATLYVFVFGLFHCGLVIAVAFGGPTFLIGAGDNSWVYSPSLQRAVTAVCYAFLALSVGMRIAQRRRRRPPGRWLAMDARLSLIGALAVAAGFLLFAEFVVSNGGLTVLTNGYGTFLESGGSSGELAYSVALIGLGSGLMVSSGGTTRRWGWAMAILFAAVCVPIGLRGTALFPMMAVVWVEGRLRRIRTLTAAAVVAVTLVLISAVRQTREAGIAGLFQGSWSISPLSAVAEMGYSLYPVVVVQRWLAGGVALSHGSTLIAVPLRFVDQLMRTNATPAALDMRLFNVEILTHAGPIGGSPVAEGLRNGGTLFMVVFLGIIGLLVGLMDSLPTTPMARAIGVVVLLPLFVTIRNAFATVPATWAIGLALVLAAVLLRRAGQTDPGG